MPIEQPFCTRSIQEQWLLRYVRYHRRDASLENAAGHAFPDPETAALDFLVAEANGCDDAQTIVVFARADHASLHVEM
ncbi:hypothetical protein GALL_542710 [mine drainage metagenome]|uniref:Uncharacterized protein n=1 Tax=mine drainage metagenome TaxID=410659 RepID=A0A1J5NZH1_9ZZZZ